MRYDPSYQYNKSDIDNLYNELFNRDSRQSGADYWMNYANTSGSDGGSVTPEKLRAAIIAGAKPGGDDYNWYQSNVLNPPTIVEPQVSDPLPPPVVSEPPPKPSHQPEQPFNPADDTVPYGKGGAPTSGSGAAGYGKGGQNTAASSTPDMFRTGGARPMGPDSFNPYSSPYSSGDYYRNTQNRQSDVFGRPSYMYSQQQRSPYMPMQPYSMGSPYQDQMGKGGQGYNQRSPYSNPYGGYQGYDMMPPRTPFYQPPQRSPMKGGGYNPYGNTGGYPYQSNFQTQFPMPAPSPQTQLPMKGGPRQPQTSPNKGSTGGNTPLPNNGEVPDLTDFSAQGGNDRSMTQDQALQDKLAQIEAMGGQQAYDQSRLNIARYNAYKDSDDYNAYTQAKGDLLGDTANRREAGSNQYVYTGNEYDTLGDPSTWDRATAINRDFYQSQGLVPMLTTQEYERLSNNLGRKPTTEELDYTRTQLAQDKNYMYDRSGTSNQAYLDYINSRGQDVQVDDKFYQYSGGNPYSDNLSDGRTTADYVNGVYTPR